MSCPRCADSVGICILVFRCSWYVAFEETNDTVASKQSIFSENQDYKCFLCIAVNMYVYFEV